MRTPEKCYYRTYIEQHPKARETRCNSCSGLNETCEDYIDARVFVALAFGFVPKFIKDRFQEEEEEEDIMGDNFPIIG